MKTACLLFGVLLGLAAASARAQPAAAPPGAYRTAAAYLRRQPRPAGTDAYFPDKRGQLVVEAPRGPATAKLRVAPDSAWGYVSGKGRAYRLYRGAEYRLEHPDTLCVYSSNTTVVDGARQGTAAGRLYYFSRGLSGLIFPLTAHYLREAYAAGNPAFAAALAQLPFHQSLVDYDRKTGLYRVTALYRAAAGMP